MVKIFKSCDIFGVSYALKTNGQEKYKSNFGACLSFAVVLIALQLTYIYGMDFFFKKNPNVLDSDVIHDSMQEIFPTTEQYPFMIRYMKDSLPNPPNMPIRINMQYLDFRTNKENNVKELYCRVREVKTNCAETPLKGDTRFAEENLNDWFCFDFEKVRKTCAEMTNNPKYKPYIGGYVQDDRLGYIQLSLSNSERNNKGELVYQSKLNEVKKLDAFMLDIRYPKFYLRKEEVKDALMTTTEVERFNLRANSFRFEYRYMKKVTLHDDVGWISESIETTNSIDLDNISPQYYTNTLEKEGWINFFDSIFLINRNEKVYKRRFMNLSDVISRVAGSLSPIIICFRFLVEFYNVFVRDHELIESLFDPIDFLAKPEERIKYVNKDSRMEESRIDLETPKEEIKIGFITYYFGFIFRKNPILTKSKEFFATARGIMERKMDVRSILEFNEKFEKLCQLILTDEQKNEVKRASRTSVINNK